MGYDTTVRDGVATADSITTSLQVNIRHYAWIGANDRGGPLYASPVTIKAIVDMRPRLRRTSDGTEVMQRCQVTIPRPIRPNGAAGRREPIDPRDKIVLPDGFTGPILDIEGPVDPVTNRPYISDIRMR